MTAKKGNGEAPSLSIQDRRKQILRQVSDKKKAISSSLSSSASDEVASLPVEPKILKRSLSPSPVSSRRAHSKSPKRPRSTSPIGDSPKKKRKKAVRFVNAESQEVSFVYLPLQQTVVSL